MVFSLDDFVGFDEPFFDEDAYGGLQMFPVEKLSYLVGQKEITGHEKSANDIFGFGDSLDGFFARQ